MPFNSSLTFIAAFLFVDMAYYWFHRAAHGSLIFFTKVTRVKFSNFVFVILEVNVFWAAHQVHHSSEEYNLSVSLRQSIIQAYTSAVS